MQLEQSFLQRFIGFCGSLKCREIVRPIFFDAQVDPRALED